MLARIGKIAGLIVTILCWRWALRLQPAPLGTLLLIGGAPLLAFPISVLGRYSLNKLPTAVHAQRTNIFVHYAMMIALGISIFPAIWKVAHQPHGTFPFPWQLGVTLEVVTGIATALTVLNLGLRGFGAPCAVML